MSPVSNLRRYIPSSTSTPSTPHTNGSNGTSTSIHDERTVPPMGMTGREFLTSANQTINEIEQYYSNLASRPVLPSIEPGYLRKLLPDEAPSQPETWDEISKDIEAKIMPGITHWQHPKYMAFFPASSTYPGILGDMWSGALTNAGFNWICSPAVTELETVVLDWVAQMIGLPESYLSRGEGGGVIQGSASEAVVTVMVAARERYIRRQIKREGISDSEEVEDRSCELRSKLVALGSDQSHSSTQKAAIIAGTRYRSVPAYKSDNFGLTGKALRKKIEELKAKGLVPYFLTVTLGTTSTCGVDNFEEIASVLRDYPDVWVHCDAAYAGAALVLPEYQHLSKQMAPFDSFDMNMHKWLLTNFDASCLFVQRRRDLTDALSITPSYLRNQFSDSGLVTDYRDWQIPLGRRFRALKIWFVIRTYGVEGMKAHIVHHMKLGDLFADLVRSRSDLFSLLTPPAFALTVLTVNPRRGQQAHLGAATNGEDPRPDQDSHLPVVPAVSDQELTEANGITKEVYTRIDETREIFLTSSVIGGAYAIRVVSANPLAEEKSIRRAFEVLVQTAEEILQKR